MRPAAILLLAILFFLLVASPALALDPARPADEFSVAGWTMQDGLPHNLVHRIAQDREGFLWVGTWEGAARFDGLGFTRFDARSEAGPAIVGVRGLLLDEDGSMLFGTTQGGVQRLREGRWEALGGPDAQRLKVTTLLRDRDGALWIGTEESLYRLDRDHSLHAVGATLELQGNMVFSILQAANGDLLIGTSRGLHRLRDGHIETLGKLLGLPSSNMRSLLASRDGSVVVGGDAGVWRIDATQSVAELLLDERVEAVIEDRHGTLWMSTSARGLLRLHAGRLESIGRSSGLDGRGSSALFEDREGLVWLGTTSGLFRVSDGPVHGIDEARGLGDNYVRSVLQAADGAMWIGHSNGVDRWLDGKLEKVDLSALGLPVSSVLSQARASDGGVLLGTYDQGVLHVPGTAVAARALPARLTREHGLPSNHVRALVQTRDGALWIGTTEGLAEWRNGTLKTLTRANGLPADFIRTLHESADGVLWIGTAAGIARRNADGSVRAWGPNSDFPAIGSFDFLEDADGTLWITSDRGLLRMRDGRFTRYDHAVGLPGDTLFRILDDGLGMLWLSSNTGLFGIRRSDIGDIDAGRRAELTVDVIDQSDGMPSSQANGGSSPAGWRSNDGKLWFPTSDGVAVVDPRVASQPANTPVPVAFKKLVVDGVALVAGDLHVLAPETRRLAIGYAGINLRAAHDVRYRYRMTGFDDRWLDVGDETEAVFTNLPPGRFRFEVQALLQLADWQHASGIESSSIAFEIRAPYWRSAWFIALMLMLFAMLLGAVHRWRIASLRRREQQLGSVIELRTRELSEKNQALQQAHHQREALLHKLAHLAHHDSLTGLPNRRAGDRHLLQAIATARSTHGTLCVGLLDIDRFKRINDEHGHDAGDATLKMVAQVLRDSLAEDGFATRHGGEEFLLSFTGLDAHTARARFEKLRVRIAETPVHGLAETTLHCTVSIGLASWSPEHEARSLLALADKRLYRAKQRGRNQVVADERELD